jgi:hypothetical protein
MKITVKARIDKFALVNQLLPLSRVLLTLRPGMEEAIWHGRPCYLAVYIVENVFLQ